MVVKFKPQVNKVYFINQYSLFHILEGNGSIEVDFKHYFDWDDKLIFLEKGQYIKFQTDNFTVRKIEFKDEVIFRDKSTRVLFKHLVSMGYINYLECDECQKYLSDTLFSSPKDIIDVSSKQWFWQNPFDANIEEYHVIFDYKDLIDKQFKNNLSSAQIVQLLNAKNRNAHNLVKEKIGLTVKGLFSEKRLLESQKAIAFTDKSIKEIAHDFDFKDPAYFNRVFKKNTALSPQAFREKVNFQKEDYFTQELFELLKEFHTTQRKVDFYAKKMFMSEKTFSKAVKQKLNISIGQLIRHEIIKTAKHYLSSGMSIKETAFTLGFNEINHFSSFFKHYTHQTPSSFISKKYNS